MHIWRLMPFCYIYVHVLTRPIRTTVYIIFYIVFLRHAFPSILDLSTRTNFGVFRELCRLILNLWILTMSDVLWPLMAAVPLVDVGPWRLGDGTWGFKILCSYVWRTLVVIPVLKQWFQFSRVLRPFHIIIPALLYD